jgi:hypothetical protein
MRINPRNINQTDLYKDLSPLDKVMRKIAIVVVFIGVFYWALKVVFGI